MSKRIITREELAQHRTAQNIWMAIHGKVYDLTSFMGEHPGGDAIMLDFAGVDASESFDDAIHSQEAVKMLDQYFVGLYSPTGAPVAEVPPKTRNEKADNSADSSSTKKLSLTQRMTAMKAQSSAKSEQKASSSPVVPVASASGHSEGETKATKSVSIGSASQSPSTDSRPPRRSSTGTSTAPTGASKTVTGTVVGLAVEQAKQPGAHIGADGEDKMLAKDIIRSLALGPAATGVGAPAAGAGAPAKSKNNQAKMNSLGWVAYDSDDSDEGNPALKRRGSNADVEQSSTCLIL